MPAHSRSKNGVAEPVIGPATSGRTRWLAHVGGIHVLNAMPEQDVDGRDKPGHNGPPFYAAAFAQSALVASRAPSTRLSNLAQTISGSISGGLLV
jgi:hypothetical protein